jgi:tetraacyldisaccharide 4'-kinase
MRKILMPLGKIYSRLSQIRYFLYQKGHLKTEILDAPVISVGNLTVGGTGKTPFVDQLLTQLEKAEIKACVLTRGYGRSTDEIIIVNGTTLPSAGGDEPVWLARRHPKSIVAVGANRVQGALAVAKLFKPDVYILDDGFQHFKIKRNLDIVLIDCTRPSWHYDVLPMGFGREPFSEIRRAQIVVLTRSNQVLSEVVDRLERQIQKLGVSNIFRSQILFKVAKDIGSGKEYDLRNKNVYLLSGIANPQSFESLVRNIGGNVLFHKEKPDHYSYTLESFLEILTDARKRGADLLVTTEKDAVKLKVFEKVDKAVAVVQVETELQFTPPLPEIKKWVGL